MKYEFQVGDRVAAIVDKPQGNPHIRTGLTGTVCHIGKWMADLAQVRWDFDEPHTGNCGHDCDGHCDPGYGWNVLFKEIELIEPAGGVNHDFDMSESEIFDLLGGVV